MTRNGSSLPHEAGARQRLRQADEHILTTALAMRNGKAEPDDAPLAGLAFTTCHDSQTQ